MSTYSKFSDKKASFDEMLDAEDKALHNSNMLNLVSAVRSIDDEVKQLNERLAKLNALKIEIKQYADKGDLENTTEVRRLHGLATKDRLAAKHNW